ncbi:hypothetical protein AVEN_48033-1 [Araneus ventricosus]|uniref:Uncharacterized protein n=1 Tax=Araneus ventricosus TaxID=182803 RepID=A0A4Y2LYC0_ARAVE|nr:hypothetical protein AVEN_48033-1 [Araneus ventricosus]
MVWKVGEGCQFRCRPLLLTTIQNYELSHSAKFGSLVTDDRELRSFDESKTATELIVETRREIRSTSRCKAAETSSRLKKTLDRVRYRSSEVDEVRVRMAKSRARWCFAAGKGWNEQEEACRFKYDCRWKAGVQSGDDE